MANSRKINIAPSRNQGPVALNPRYTGLSLSFPPTWSSSLLQAPLSKVNLCRKKEVAEGVWISDLCYIVV